MDLILVMKERLRDQSAEVRSLTRNFTLLGSFGTVLLFVAFLLSPQMRSGAISNSESGVSGSPASGSLSSAAKGKVETGNTEGRSFNGASVVENIGPFSLFKVPTDMPNEGIAKAQILGQDPLQMAPPRRVLNQADDNDEGFVEDSHTTIRRILSVEEKKPGNLIGRSHGIFQNPQLIGPIPPVPVSQQQRRVASPMSRDGDANPRGDRANRRVVLDEVLLAPDDAKANNEGLGRSGAQLEKMGVADEDDGRKGNGAGNSDVSGRSSAPAVVTSGSYVLFLFFSAAAVTLLTLAVNTLLESRFISTYYSPTGLAKANGPFQLTTYIGSSPDSQSYRGVSVGGQGFRLAPLTSPTTAGPSSSQPSLSTIAMIMSSTTPSHLFLFPLHWVHYQIPVSALFVLIQMAAVRGWQWFVLLALMMAMYTVIVLRIRLLWRVIGLATSTR